MKLANYHIDSTTLQKNKIFHLVRETSVKKCEENGALLVEKCNQRGIKLSYDVNYGGHPHELRYSEFFAGLGGIQVQPCCGQIIRKMWKQEYDTSNNIDFASYIKDRPDKYVLHTYEIPEMESSALLPGSNLLTKTVDKEKLNAAALLGARIKPHPLTNDSDAFEVLGSEYVGLVLPRTYSGFNVMLKSRYVFTTGASELGLYAMLLGKYVIDISTQEPSGGYFDIFKESVKANNQKERLNYLLNHPAVGVIMPGSEDNMDRFLDLYQEQLPIYLNETTK